MDYPETVTERLENAWRAKVEAAEAQYSENPCIETKATYLGLLRIFADFVLRHEAGQTVPDGASSRAEAVQSLRGGRTISREATMPSVVPPEVGFGER